MRFWDSSALVPLLTEEETSEAVLEVYLQDEEVITWWGSPVECASALARLEREGGLNAKDAQEAFHRLAILAKCWHEIEPGQVVRDTAQRLLRVHNLRAADSLQLAAAFWASEGHPSTLELVSLDDRLGLAAQREGFTVLDRLDLR
ncbi:MAG: type II toxin-antitoxin system VapC family toxin [Thermoanaerobaculia bacterium]